MPRVAAIIAPQVMVVTGLFRDQLDRYGEVAKVRAALAEAASATSGTMLVLNGDDPLTASLEAKQQVISASPTHRSTCRRTEWTARAAGRSLPLSPATVPSSASIAARPAVSPPLRADVSTKATKEGFFVDGRAVPPLPESLHPYNALAAIAAVRALGIDVEPVSWPPPVPGRGSTAAVDADQLCAGAVKHDTFEVLELVERDAMEASW